jgi:hypothetical protein
VGFLSPWPGTAEAGAEFKRMPNKIGKFCNTELVQAYLSSSLSNQAILRIKKVIVCSNNY